VEASTNLADWIAIATNLLNTGAWLFEDPERSIYRSRYYRVRY
jgi:hypothetical protein